jgi:hypothetical protein
MMLTPTTFNKNDVAAQRKLASGLIETQKEVLALEEVEEGEEKEVEEEEV